MAALLTTYWARMAHTHISGKHQCEKWVNQRIKQLNERVTYAFERGIVATRYCVLVYLPTRWTPATYVLSESCARLYKDYANILLDPQLARNRCLPWRSTRWQIQQRRHVCSIAKYWFSYERKWFFLRKEKLLPLKVSYLYMSTFTSMTCTFVV